MTLFRATYSGALSSSEAFAFGWAFSDATNGDAAAQVTACSTWLDTFLDTLTTSVAPKSVFTTGVTWNKLTVSQYFAGNVIGSALAGLSRAGISAGSMMPYEVAMCVSLTSTATTGPKRGRFYLPPFGTGNMNAQTGTMNSVGALDVLQGGLNAAFDAFVTADRKVGVLRNTPGSLTEFNQCNVVSIGNVPDSQRRRRNKQIEVRVPHTIV